MAGYVGNISDITAQNDNFRKVVYTGVHVQLVVMSLEPNEEIGIETHGNLDQFFFLKTGTLKIVMNGTESTLSEGMAAVVPAGIEHNVVNVGANVAKLFTVYSPPNHPDQLVQAKKVVD